tara:strand:- start:226 stop:393 length:168 start_codon:yes stop_codon:yes gene_type:complete
METTLQLVRLKEIMEDVQRVLHIEVLVLEVEQLQLVGKVLALVHQAQALLLFLEH